jgi:hypothetical protein
MVTALVTVLLLSAPAGASARVAPIRAEGAPATPAVPLSGPEDVTALCKRLVPTERLRAKGDAVERGEAEAQHERARGQAVTARYALTISGDKLTFAPYDGPEQRLALSDTAPFRLSPAVTLFLSDARGLPVQVNAAVARRVLAAQTAARLALRLVFDLPDEAVCTSDRRGQRFTLGVEPVEWTWLEGDGPLAVGSVAADRPPVSLAVGAQATVDVGEPIAGPSEARKAVIARRAELVACYAEGLKSSPELDGVVVVDLGAKVVVSADSTGSADLARCVERALGSLAGAARASVPIRFELSLPRAGGGAATPEADGAAAR